MRILAVLSLVCFLSGCGQKGSKPVSFRDDIQPILHSRCTKCHGSEQASGKVVLTSFENLMNSHTVHGKKPLVTSGNPSESWLYILCATDQPHFRMPPDTSRLTPLPKKELELLAKWILQGTANN